MNIIQFMYEHWFLTWLFLSVISGAWVKAGVALDHIRKK